MKKAKQRPEKKRAAGQLPDTGTASDIPHVGRAMRGCACIQCAHHRTLDRQAKRDAAAIYDEYGDVGGVRVGETATKALRDVLGAE